MLLFKRLFLFFGGCFLLLCVLVLFDVVGVLEFVNLFLCVFGWYFLRCIICVCWCFWRFFVVFGGFPKVLCCFAWGLFLCLKKKMLRMCRT